MGFIQGAQVAPEEQPICSIIDLFINGSSGATYCYSTF
jgi:hypothetical protein